MPTPQQNLQMLMTLYPHDKLMQSYIESESPYFKEAQQHLDTGTSATDVFDTILQSMGNDTPLSTPVPVTEVTPDVPTPPVIQQPAQEPFGPQPVTEEQQLAAMTEEDFMSLLSSFPAGEIDPEVQAYITATQKYVAEQQKAGPANVAARIERMRAESDSAQRPGLLGVLDGIMGQNQIETYVRNEASLSAAGMTLSAYMKTMDKLNETIVFPFKRGLLGAGVKAASGVPSAAFIEKKMQETVEGTGKMSEVELIETLQTLFQRGVLPPSDKYSDKFKEKITNDPHYQKYLWIMADRGSRAQRGEYVPFIGPEVIADAQNIPMISPLAVPIKGLVYGSAAAEEVIKTAVEWSGVFDARQWVFELAGWAGVTVLLGPAMKAATLARTAGTATKAQRFVSWDIGKAFHNYILKHYDAPVVKRILAKEVDIPAQSVANFLKRTDDDFLADNDLVVAALQRMEKEDPKYMQHLIDTLQNNVDDLDNVVVPVSVPRASAKLIANAGKVEGKQIIPAYHGVLDTIAKNEGDDVAALTERLWEKGIDTLSSSVTEGSNPQIIIEIERLSDEAYETLRSALSRKDLAVTYSGRGDIDYMDHIRIRKPEVATVLQALDDMDPIADPVMLRKSGREFNDDLEGMVARGELHPTDLEDIQGRIEPPIQDDTVTPRVEEPLAAAPATDTGAAAPPVEGLPGPEPTVPPPSGVWSTPLDEYVLRTDLPADLKQLHNMPARVKDGGFDVATEKQVDSYLTRLGRAVEKYTPERMAIFREARITHMNQRNPRYKTAGEFEKFLQFSHRKASEIMWLDEMAATGIDDAFSAAVMTHRQAVEGALRAGMEVPDNVLVDYPDLTAVYAPKPSKPVQMATLKKKVNNWQSSYKPPENPVTPSIPGDDAPVINKEALRELGWVDNEINKMNPEDATRVLSERLEPHQVTFDSRGKIVPVSPQVTGTVAASDVAPPSMANQLLHNLNDENLMQINQMRQDPLNVSHNDVLQSLRGISPEIDSVLENITADNATQTIDDLIRMWTENSTDNIHAHIKAMSDTAYRSWDERTRTTMGNLYKTVTRKAKDPGAPTITDPAIQAVYAAGRVGQTNRYKQTIAAMKHSIIEEADKFAGSPRILRKDHTQFWDDIRTGLHPIGARASYEADMTMGAIYQDLTKAEKESMMQILGLRDLLETLSNDMDVTGGLTAERITAELTEMMNKANPHIIGGLDRYYDIMRRIGQDLISRGNMHPRQLRSNYFPHYVMEYTPDWMLDSNFKPHLPSSIHKPYRRYVKQRTGSAKEISLSPEALRTHFASIYADNMLDDWAMAKIDAEDLWTRLAKPGMSDDDIKAARIAVFGEANGRVITPKPGQRYHVDGIEEPFVGYQYQRGNNLYRETAVNRSVLGHVLEDALLMDPNAAELVASQLDIDAIAKGAMPDELKKLIEGAGDRGGNLLKTVLAVGKANRTYVVPESIAKAMQNYKNNSLFQIPALYDIMKFTSIWKGLTLSPVGAGIPFQMGNLSGDMFNLYRTAPGAIKEFPFAFKLLKDLNKPQKLIDDTWSPFQKKVLTVALEKDVLGSGFAAEYARVNTIYHPVHWNRAFQKLGALREASTRVAMLSHQMKLFERTGKFHAPEFQKVLYDAAGNLKLDPDSAAAFIARNFTVDYDALPLWYNQIIRGAAFPFMTFWHKNAENWAKYIWNDPKGFSAKFVAPRVMAHVWNTRMFPDVEAALGGLRRRGHLNLARIDIDGDGIPDYGIVLAPQLPVDMAGQWFGLDRLEEKLTLAMPLDRDGDGIVEPPLFTPREVAEMHLKDMGLGVPRMLGKLAGPLGQYIIGRLANKDLRTGQPLLPYSVKEMPPGQARKYYAKYALSLIVTPAGQYMRDSFYPGSRENLSMFDVMGINLSPTARTLLTGPLDFFRGAGIFVIDLKRGDLELEQKIRQVSVQREAKIKNRIMDAFWSADDYPPTREGIQQFFETKEAQTILDDAVSLGLSGNKKALKPMFETWLTSISFQHSKYTRKAHRAKTQEERLAAMKSLQYLDQLRTRKSLTSESPAVRREIIRRLQLQKRSKGKEKK